MIVRDPLGGRAFAGTVRRSAWAVACAAWIASFALILATPDFYPRWFSVLAFAGSAAPLVWAIRTLRAPAGPTMALQVFTVVAWIIGVAQPFVVSQPAGRLDNAPLLHLAIVGMAVSACVVTFRVGAPLVVIECAAILVGRAPVVGWGLAIAEQGQHLAAGLLPYIAVRVARADADRVATATAKALDARTRATAAASRSLARQRLDGLIHDKVLAALMLAGRGRASEASGLALDALVHLAPEAAGGDSGNEPDSLTVIKEHAGGLGLRLMLEADDWPGGQSGEALRAATCEALTNVSRHSGAGAATVRAGWRGQVFVAEVVDRGAGFDPTTIPPGRLGVRERIVGALAAIGAEARIESRHGQGTRVIMSAVPTTIHELGTDAESVVGRTLLAAAPVVAAATAGAIVAGTRFLDKSWSEPLAITGMMVVPVLAVLLALTPARSRTWIMAVLATVGTWAALLANVRDPATLDWRFWFVGLFDVHLGIIAARRDIRMALMVIGAANALGVGVWLARGESNFWVPLFGNTFQCVAWAIGMGWFARASRRAAAKVSQQMVLTAEAEEAVARASALQAEITARQGGLDADVMPLLARIATGAPLAAPEAQRCHELEAATRDQLVAGSVLAPELVAAIADARGRGCRVSIVGRVNDGLATLGTSAGLDAFRGAATAILAIADGTDRITLRWAPDPTGQLATAVLAGSRANARPLAALAFPGVDIAVSAERDAILIEVQQAGSGRGGEAPGPDR